MDTSVRHTFCDKIGNEELITNLAFVKFTNETLSPCLMQAFMHLYGP